MIDVIVDPFRTYLDLYFVLQALWTRTGLPKIAYFLTMKFYSSVVNLILKFLFKIKPNKYAEKLNIYESK